MSSQGFRLGVDFGTSNTVAVLRRPDGRLSPLLFDGTPLLPSAVYAAPAAPQADAGPLLVGAGALHSAAGRPEAVEPNPKRRIDDDTVLLGPREVPVVDLIAAILTQVRAEATRVAGVPVGAVTLTHPAAWGSRRRAILTEAAVRAGFDPPDLLPEPVAAALRLAALIRVSAGDHLLVYDFGAGTFDASVVRRTGAGYEVLGNVGVTDAGGLDIDAAVMAYLGATYAPRDPDAWHRLTHPTDTATRRANRQLWDDVRRAKELLSRVPSTSVYLPLLDIDAPLGREQLEELARPVVARTVGATVGMLRDLGVSERQLAAVFLVGGGSRLPLAASMLHQALAIAPTTVEQPEMVVAEGSVDSGPLPTAPPLPGPTTVLPSPPPAARPRRWLRPVVGALAVVLLAAAGAAVVRYLDLFGADPACDKRIGVFAPATGSWATLGTGMREGVQSAVDEYNRKHGSCLAAVRVYDTDKSTAEALADGSLLGIVGPLLSADVIRLGPGIEEAGLPMITPSATDANLSSRGWSTFHRIIAGDADQGVAAARYLTVTLRANRVYVLDDGSDYGVANAGLVQRALGQYIAGSGNLRGNPGFDKVAESNPDAIYFGGTPAEAPGVLTALHARGITVPVIGPDALHDPAFAQRVGADADGLAVTCLCTGNPPDSFGSDPVKAYAYDATNVFLAGIAGGVDNRAAMLRYVNGSRTDGVMGHYQFQANGELASLNVAILAIKQGRFTNAMRIAVR